MPDALQILREDHRKVKEIFRQFEDAEDQQTKKSLVDQAIVDLTVHAELEEQIFYPAVRREGGTAEMIDEAEEEHHVVDVLLDELRGMKPNEERWAAKFSVLCETVRHHIDEEEANTLPKAAELGPEALHRIGQEMEMRRPALMQQAQRTGSSRQSGGGRSGSRSTSGSRSRTASRRTTRGTGARSSTRRTTATRGSRSTSSTSTGARRRASSSSRTGRGTRTSRSTAGSRGMRSSAGRSTRARTAAASRGTGGGRTARSSSTAGSRGMRASSRRGQSRTGRRTTATRSRSRN